MNEAYPELRLAMPVFFDSVDGKFREEDGVYMVDNKGIPGVYNYAAGYVTPLHGVYVASDALDPVRAARRIGLEKGKMNGLLERFIASVIITYTGRERVFIDVVRFAAHTGTPQTGASEFFGWMRSYPLNGIPWGETIPGLKSWLPFVLRCGDEPQLIQYEVYKGEVVDDKVSITTL